MRRAITAAFVVMLLGAVAFATTLASSYPALFTELRTRLAAIPTSGATKDQKKQKKPLTAAIAVMNVDAAALDGKKGTLANATALVDGLDKAFPGDTTLGPMLDTVVADMSDAVNSRLTALHTGAAALPDGKAKTALNKTIAKADAAYAAAGTATTRKAKLKALATALKFVLTAEKALAKAQGGGIVNNESTLTIHIGSATGKLPSQAVGQLFSTTYTDISAGGVSFQKFNMSMLGVQDQTRADLTYGFNFFVTYDAGHQPGKGQFPVDLVLTGSYTDSDRTSAQPPLDGLPLTAGSVTFTAWQTKTVKGKAPNCAGSIDLTFSDVPTGGSTTVHMTGDFNSLDLIVQ